MKKATVIMLIAMLVGCMGTATAQKRSTSNKKTTVVAKFDPSQFTGVWANGYNSGYGDDAAMVCDTLALNYDAATGAISGFYKSESGVITELKGEIKGREVTITEVASGDEFAGGKLYNKSTLKLDTFTGTFKRVSDKYSPMTNPATEPVKAAAPGECKNAEPCDQCKTNPAECKSNEPCDQCKAARQQCETPRQDCNAAPQQCEAANQECKAAQQCNSGECKTEAAVQQQTDKVAATKKAAEAVRKAAAAAKPVPTP